MNDSLHFIFDVYRSAARKNDKHGNDQACKGDPERQRLTVSDIEKKTAEPGADCAAEADAKGEITEDCAKVLAVKNVDEKNSERAVQVAPDTDMQKSQRNKAITPELVTVTSWFLSHWMKL
jgi:hypothetical protein